MAWNRWKSCRPAVYDREGRGRSLDLGYRDRAVEGHDRARDQRGELVVELQDLPPIRGRGHRRIAVDRVDRGLDLLRARLAQPQALATMAWPSAIRPPSHTIGNTARNAASS